MGFISNDKCHWGLYLRPVWFAKSVVSCPSPNRQTEACTSFLLPVILALPTKGCFSESKHSRQLASSSWPCCFWKERYIKRKDLIHEKVWRGPGWEVTEDIWSTGLSLSASLGMSSFALGFWALYLTVVAVSSLAKEETTPGMCLPRLYHGLSPLDIFPSRDMFFLCGLGWLGIHSVTKLPLSWPPVQLSITLSLQAWAAHLSPVWFQ